MKRQVFVILGVAVLGVVAGAIIWMSGVFDVSDAVTAGVEEDKSPATFTDTGLIALSQAQFPLGMGCSALDHDKVNALIRTELEARDINQLNGPGLVKFCDRKGDQWTLGIMAQAGPSKVGRTLELPEACEAGDVPPARAECVPSSAELAVDQIHFEIVVKDSEVKP